MQTIFSRIYVMFQGKTSTQIFLRGKTPGSTWKHWDYIYLEVTGFAVTMLQEL